MCAERTTPDLSLVIPVYNGSCTIGSLVERITRVFAFTPFQIVLVNDGSEDDSEIVCAKLAEKFPQSVTFVHLSRNFGEHSAVLAGLSHARGRYIAVLDDDGQNPPEEIVPMLQELKRKNLRCCLRSLHRKTTFMVPQRGEQIQRSYRNVDAAQTKRPLSLEFQGYGPVPGR